MLWTNKGNQLIIYTVEINEEQIKNILDDIILKYGNESNKVVTTQMNTKQANVHRMGRNFIKVFDKDQLEISTKGKHYSMLVSILVEILKNDITAIVKLYKYKKSEYAEEYIEYIDLTLENINLIQFYSSPFSNTFDLIEKLITNSCYNQTLGCIESRKLPYEVVSEVEKRKVIQKSI